MYVETSVFSLQTGDVAVLRSPKYNVSSLSCNFCMLEFWYHMYGATIGRLEVEINQRNILHCSISTRVCKGVYRGTVAPLQRVDADRRSRQPVEKSKSPTAQYHVCYFRDTLRGDVRRVLHRGHFN